MTNFPNSQTETFESKLIDLGVNNYPALNSILNNQGWARFKDSRKNKTGQDLGIRYTIQDSGDAKGEFYNWSNKEENFYHYDKTNQNQIIKTPTSQNKPQTYKFIYGNSKDLTGESLYLENKGIGKDLYLDIGLKINEYKGNRSLLVPFFNKIGELRQVELIDEKTNDEGKFGKKKHGSFDNPKNGDRKLIYATTSQHVRLRSKRSIHRVVN